MNGVHPKDVVVCLVKCETVLGVMRIVRNSIPLFLIVRASCHNPHKWNGRKDNGPGRKTEVDVINSSLNVTNTEDFVCSDCHGLDSLFRYKYFHSPSSRKKHRLYE